jgi:hypothetical protein
MLVELNPGWELDTGLRPAGEFDCLLIRYYYFFIRRKNSLPPALGQLVA